MFNNAGVEPPHFPMRVNEFLANGHTYLRRGDILLSRSATVFSWLIRLATNSPFSHCALVFLLPQPEKQLYNTFLLESIKSGVGVANLRSYISNKSERNQIAIKRLNQPWADDEFQKQVGGIMLDYVHAGYDFNRALKIGWTFLFGVTLGWFKLFGKPNDTMSNAVKRTKRLSRNWIPPEFICGGFVQYGFLQAQMRHNGNPQDVIFRDGLNEYDRDELLAITPEDIAQSNKLEWAYVISRGWVHEVKSYADASKLISGGRR
jgi:Permuted papain-like amidase enzyme, YaeF/YiiX, C92 family